jgi:hypothetical protein
MRGTRIVLLTVIFTAVFNFTGSANQAKPYIYFQTDFDGNTKAGLDGNALAAKSEANTKYQKSTYSQALELGKGTKVSYELAGEFPYANGALALYYRPNFPQDKHQKNRTILRMNVGDNYILELRYQANGRKWIYVLDHVNKFGSLKRELIVWHGSVKEGKWCHLLLTWDKEIGRFDLYQDDKFKYQAKYNIDLKGSVRLEIGGDVDLQTSIDEVIIYNRSITKEQVKTFSQAAARPGQERWQMIEKKLVADDLLIKKRKDLVDQLKGKVAYVRAQHECRDKLHGLPEDIQAICIHPEDVSRTDLSGFKVIWFAGSHDYKIDQEGEAAISEFVKSGGGYLGSSHGTFLAEKLKLLSFEAGRSNIYGIIEMVYEPHIINGFKKKTHGSMHFSNGPLMRPGEGCDVIANYTADLPGKVNAAVIAGTYGKGNVILFGPNPLGGNVSRNGIKIIFNGRDLGTEKMAVNALLYTAKVINN